MSVKTKKRFKNLGKICGIILILMLIFSHLLGDNMKIFAKPVTEKLSLIWCISETGDDFYACELLVNTDYQCGFPRACL